MRGSAREEASAGLAAKALPPMPASEQEATLNAGGFQAVFQIPGRVSVAASEGAKSFRIATAMIAPRLVVRAAPALDPTGYLEASFKQTEEAPLLPGRVALYRDGTYVGRAQMKLAPKDETVRLGFGADEKVAITRTLLRKIEGSTGIISSSRTDEREFKITVRNGHGTPDRGGDRRSDPGERGRRRAGRTPARNDAAERTRRAGSPRRAALEF